MLMSISVKLIKFLSGSSLVILLATYFLSVNMEVKLISLDSVWISNNFLFTVVGGMFVSFFVLLIVELEKYFISKKAVEDSIYCNCAGLYNELIIEFKNIEMYLTNTSEIIPKTVLEYRRQLIEDYNNCLRSLDYKTFNNKNILVKQFNLFKREEIKKNYEHINMCRYLPIAIDKAKLDFLEKGITGTVFTASDNLVGSTLVKIKRSTEIRMIAIDGFLENIASIYPDRYNWKAEKEIMNAMKLNLEERERKNKEFFSNK